MDLRQAFKKVIDTQTIVLDDEEQNTIQETINLIKNIIAHCEKVKENCDADGIESNIFLDKTTCKSINELNRVSCELSDLLGTDGEVYI